MPPAKGPRPWRDFGQPRRGVSIAEDYALHIGVSPAEIAALRHALVELNYPRYCLGNFATIVYLGSTMFPRRICPTCPSRW